MKNARLNLGKVTQQLPAIVASQIYWYVISPKERRWLAVREEMIEFCAVRIAKEIAHERHLGEIFQRPAEKRTFLSSVRNAMDHIRRNDREAQILRRLADDPAFKEEIPPPENISHERIPQQLSLCV